MCGDRDEDRESGGTQDGEGTPPTFTPIYRPQQFQKNTPRANEPPDEIKENPGELEEYSEPCLSDFDSIEELDNGYKLVTDGDTWLLFDDDGKFIQRFGNREAAEKRAYTLKPPPSYGM